MNKPQPKYEGDTKIVPIRSRDGAITGYAKLYWSGLLGYVSIPDADDGEIVNDPGLGFCEI